MLNNLRVSTKLAVGFEVAILMLLLVMGARPAEHGQHEGLGRQHVEVPLPHDLSGQHPGTQHLR